MYKYLQNKYVYVYGLSVTLCAQGVVCALRKGVCRAAYKEARKCRPECRTPPRLRQESAASEGTIPISYHIFISLFLILKYAQVTYYTDLFNFPEKHTHSLCFISQQMFSSWL